MRLRRIIGKLLVCYFGAAFVHFVALLFLSQGFGGGHFPLFAGILILIVSGPFGELQNIWNAFTLEHYSRPEASVCRPCIIEQSSWHLVFFFVPFVALAIMSLWPNRGHRTKSTERA
jgi:hypothetical protein